MTTNVLILAAGNGKRLIDSKPKPLYQLLGLPLLTRTLLSFEEAKFTDAYIVLGYEADTIKESIEKNHRFKIKRHWLKNESWHKENGISVLSAEDVLDGPFVLAMCDHIFDPDIISTLQQGSYNPQGIKLLVDYDLQGIFDENDATKVKVSHGRILKIHKNLLDYNAVDTGFFLANPSLFQAIKQAGIGHKWSLSDGVQKLADKGLVEAVDIKRRMWHDVDTQKEARNAEKKIMASLGKPDDGPVARVLNRPLSKALSRFLVKTGIGPNLVTLFNLVLGLAAAFTASFGGYFPFLTAAVLFQLNSIIDGTDGELARLKFQVSRSGQWFDTIADNIVYIALLLGIALGIKKASLPMFFFHLGIGGVLFGIAAALSLYVYLLRTKKSGSLLEVKYGYEHWNSRLSRMIYYLGKRDIWAAGLLLLALTGWIHLATFYFFFYIFGLFLISLKFHFPVPKKSSLKRDEKSLSPSIDPVP
ncbi:MAG: NTP transferase domain-containing protein [Candidatus Aminicenantes bacterium]|nr:NTP transferase domain-containing protein [Candidatus Aminicenantes bacterium]